MTSRPTKGRPAPPPPLLVTLNPGSRTTSIRLSFQPGFQPGFRHGFRPGSRRGLRRGFRPGSRARILWRIRWRRRGSRPGLIREWFQHWRAGEWSASDNARCACGRAVPVRFVPSFTAAHAGTPTKSTLVSLTMPLSTFLGVADQPGRLDMGPVAAGLARRIAQDAAREQPAWTAWRCIVTDDTHGTVLGVTDPIWTPRHDPPPRLTRLVEAMKPVCVFPGCRQPARPLRPRPPHPPRSNHPPVTAGVAGRARATCRRSAGHIISRRPPAPSRSGRLAGTRTPPPRPAPWNGPSRRG